MDLTSLYIGGVVTGRSLAAALCLGADGVWVGSRFVASNEANCNPLMKQAYIHNSGEDTLVTKVATGAPLRIINNRLVEYFHDKPQEEKTG